MVSVYFRWLRSRKQDELQQWVDGEHPRDIDYEEMNRHREALQESLGILEIEEATYDE